MVKTTIKKIAALVLALALMATVFAGCTTTDNSVAPSGDTQNNEQTSLSGKISLGGSTSTEKVILSLIEAYNIKNPDVTITYDPTGSSSGITAATEGTTDIGLSSRNLKEKETGLDATAFAIDGIALIVGADNPVSNLSLQQIQDIANGTITNWSEVGGNDSPIVLIGREAGSGTRDGFESIVGVDECVYAQELTATGAVIAAVKSNPDAIGYASLASVQDSVKTLTLDNVAPTEETIKDKSYSLQRSFLMVTNQSTELSAQAKDFMKFATSEEVAEIVKNAGAIAPSK